MVGMTEMRVPKNSSDLDEVLSGDGTIYLWQGQYVFWADVDDDDLVLDGRFKVADLEKIVKHIRKVKAKKSKTPSYH